MPASKFKNPLPIKYKGRYGFWRIFNLIVFGLLAGGIMYTAYFVYENIYISLANTSVIIALKSDMEWYSLDLGSYEQAKSMIAEKATRQEIPTNLKNFFFYNSNIQSTSTYANTVTSTKK